MGLMSHAVLVFSWGLIPAAGGQSDIAGMQVQAISDDVGQRSRTPTQQNEQKGHPKATGLADHIVKQAKRYMLLRGGAWRREDNLK